MVTSLLIGSGVSYIYMQGVHNEEESFWGTTGATPRILGGIFNKMLGIEVIFSKLYMILSS